MTYYVWKDPESGHWFVRSFSGCLLYHCECREHAEEIAADLNRTTILD